jgi:HSP20 family molecular chaperone IbpA
MATTNQTLAPNERRVPERVQQRPSISPRVDVYENANELLVLADVPGATKETISVHVEKGQLTLEARRESVDHGSVVQAEYRPADYHRVFAVPEGIDASKIDAQLSAGVLRIRLPKSESLKPRRIEIKAS